MSLNGGQGPTRLKFEDDLRRLKRKINSPKTNLYERGNAYVVRMEIPAEGYEFQVEDDQILLVTCFKKEHNMCAGGRAVYEEGKYGKVVRRVKLPGKVVVTPSFEEWKNGILLLCFVKLETGITDFDNQLGTQGISWADVVD